MEFKLAWDDPAEAELTWQCMGGPDKPLNQSYAVYWNQGWEQAAGDKGEPRPLSLTRYVNGYLYGAQKPVKPLSRRQRESMQRAAERRVPEL
jgi:hypothetical protein